MFLVTSIPCWFHPVPESQLTFSYSIRNWWPWQFPLEIQSCKERGLELQHKPSLMAIWEPTLRHWWPNWKSQVSDRFLRSLEGAPALVAGQLQPHPAINKCSGKREILSDIPLPGLLPRFYSTSRHLALCKSFSSELALL